MSDQGPDRRDDLHVLPLADLRDHTESRACWCGPRLESEGALTIVVHHAADGRELVEEHGLQ